MPLPPLKLSVGEKAELRRKLCYARWLYEKGLTESRHHDELSRLVAITHFHNAIEIVVQNIVLHYSWATSPQMKNLSFNALLDMVDKKGTGTPQPPMVPHRTQVLRLAEMRNNVMHHGQRYRDTEVSQAETTCNRFLRDCVQAFFFLDFEALSMVDLVQNAWIRKRLREGELALRNGALVEAVASAAVVVEMAEGAFLQLFDERFRFSTVNRYRKAHVGPRSQSDQLSKRVDHIERFLEETERTFRDFGKDIKAIWDQVRRNWLFTICDVEAAHDFLALKLHTSRLLPGQDRQWIFRVDVDQDEIDGLKATRAVSFATNLSLKFQDLGLGPFMTPGVIAIA